MNEHEVHTDGFDAFSEILKQFSENTDTEHVLKVLEIGAKDLANDIRALPKPRSQMTAPGYTHLLDTVTHKIQDGEVIVGWGKYYGPMVENGTVKMNATSHLRPTFERNKENYYKKMQKALFG